MKNLGNLLKQAQQMQGKMAKMQEELAAQTVVGQSGGGMVEVTLNGKQEMVSIRIDKTVVDPGDVEMLEDLIAAAFNDAHAKLQDLQKQQLSQITGGLNLPPGMMPF
ncbi:MAG: YbaB/EbfC family nucleoid-associated protein [Magnetococcales bacterium]|nr:YbaB/EbfC family nucleoid-associated protein [Magnetococcales bacterium]